MTCAISDAMPTVGTTAFTPTTGAMKIASSRPPPTPLMPLTMAETKATAASSARRAAPMSARNRAASPVIGLVRAWVGRTS
jgi:hypothetical protein